MLSSRKVMSHNTVDHMSKEEKIKELNYCITIVLATVKRSMASENLRLLWSYLKDEIIMEEK